MIMSDNKAVLKAPQSKRWRDCRAAHGSREASGLRRLTAVLVRQPHDPCRSTSFVCQRHGPESLIFGACQLLLCGAKYMGMETNWAAEQLQTIRTLMERSAVYRRALGPVMLFAGFAAVG